MVKTCYDKILNMVSDRFIKGIYNLDRYRRILPGRPARYGSGRTNFTDPSLFGNGQGDNNEGGKKVKTGTRKNNNSSVLRMVNNLQQARANEELVNSDDDGGDSLNLFNQLK